MAKATRPKSALPTPLSRARILQTALDLADKTGIESLSMRKLAQALGVKAMSLYNHVANKDDIVDGIVDLVVGEIALPSLEGSWQMAMRQRAKSAHSVLLCHPWATQRKALQPSATNLRIGGLFGCSAIKGER